MNLSFPPDPSLNPAPPRPCEACGKAVALLRLPFCVGRQETPPVPQKYRLFPLGRMKRRFVQRHRWIWHFLWLCRECCDGRPSDRVWTAIQNHPSTRTLVKEGYTEIRLDPQFQGQEGEVTFTEEPV